LRHTVFSVGLTELVFHKLYYNYTTKLINVINNIRVSQEFANDYGLMICNNYKNLENIDQHIREQQLKVINNRSIIYYKLNDSDSLICNECYKYRR